MSFIERRMTRQMKMGTVPIGGDAPITIQSMTTTDTSDIEATVSQIMQLQDAGCEIIRCAVPVESAAMALGAIRSQIDIPLVADIHFNYRLALLALDENIDGLRLNPGNIGSRDRVITVVEKAKTKGIPIRIGVNAGSLEPSLLEKYGSPSSEAMVESALRHIAILEELNFHDIIVSLKATDIERTVVAYRDLATRVDYPFHIGITEAGTQFSGTVKSAIGLGLLLAEGIGDTLRISLAADPVEEVKVGKAILKSLGIRDHTPTVIACPTCGRLEVDNMMELAAKVEEEVADLQHPLQLAIMGCHVNGPGESREADLGVSLARGFGMLYKNGKLLRRVQENEVFREFMKEVHRLIEERQERSDPQTA